MAPASSKCRAAQKAQRKVEEDLLKDKQNFSRKYDSETHTATTSKATAPVSSRPNVYSIKLPLKGEVHNKLCESTRSEACGTAKFSVQTLRNFFRTLDSDGSGSISKREMIVALRANKNLQSLFLNHKQAPQTQIATQRQMEDQSVEGRRQELQNILKILREVDSDGSGSLEWDEILEFFRRAGLLLEYQAEAHKDLNNPALDLFAAGAEDENEESGADDEKQEQPLPPGMVADDSKQGGVGVAFRGSLLRPTGHPLLSDLGRPVPQIREALAILKTGKSGQATKYRLQGSSGVKDKTSGTDMLT